MRWDEAAWDGVVGDLYLSATDPAAARRLPDRLARLLGGVWVTLWQSDARSLAMIGEAATNAPAEAIAAYRAHYYQHDPWAEGVRQMAFGRAICGTELIDEATLDRSIYYNEFAAQHGIYHMVGAMVPVGTGRTGMVSALRPRSAGQYDAAAMAAMDRLVPHLSGAFALRDQVEARVAAARADGLGAALEALGVPAAVVDGHGAVLRSNRLAEGAPVLRALAGGWLADRPGQSRLLRAIAAAARGEAGGRCPIRQAGGDVVATVSPAPFGLTGRGLALVLIKPAELREAAGFGWTRAEAAVARALAEGRSPAEIAEARAVKISTVRTLLQRAQEKAACRNLRELVRAVLTAG